MFLVYLFLKLKRNPRSLGKYHEDCYKALQDFSTLRVYVKYPEQIEIVRTIYEKHFKTPNIIYLDADICRDNLLVEIEGIVNFSF